MAGITTHVLDTARGKPAEGMPVRLERQDAGGSFSLVGEGATDADGRLRTLTQGAVEAGIYRITFDTGAYFAAQKTSGFYPSVSVLFEVRDGAEHFHVPLLISPWGYSTYRGS
jgi:5-hydroxyisourate hydrolase